MKKERRQSPERVPLRSRSQIQRPLRFFHTAHCRLWIARSPHVFMCICVRTRAFVGVNQYRRGRPVCSASSRKLGASCACTPGTLMVVSLNCGRAWSPGATFPLISLEGDRGDRQLARPTRVKCSWRGRRRRDVYKWSASERRTKTPSDSFGRIMLFLWGRI